MPSIRWPANSEPIATSAMGQESVGGEDGYDPAATAGLEIHASRAGGEDRVVLADPGPLAGLEAGAALAHDDLAAGHDLAREHLHAEALGGRVAPVAAGSESLLVSHAPGLLTALDVRDLEPGQVRPRAHALLVAALRLELEHVDLLAALMAADDGFDLHLAEVARLETGILAVAGDQARLEGG